MLINTDKKSRDRDPLDSDDRVVTCRLLPESVENTRRDSLSLPMERSYIAITLHNEVGLALILVASSRREGGGGKKSHLIRIRRRESFSS